MGQRKNSSRSLDEHEVFAEAWRKEPGETTEYEPPKDDSKPSSLGNAWEADEISGPGQVW